ncbi:uncharacterized protein DS421_18g602180 [Arachis hypogaea]|nr:uncharacterized protein DS421_18g602180 [Arachis hypogaea]
MFVSYQSLLDMCSSWCVKLLKLAGHASANRQIEASKYCGSCYQRHNGFETFISGSLFIEKKQCTQKDVLNSMLQILSCVYIVQVAAVAVLCVQAEPIIGR